MRKLLFAALAGVFMLSSGFVSGEVAIESDFQNCTYSISRAYIDSRGEPQVETKTFSREVLNDLECTYVSTSHVWYLNQGEIAW